MKIKKYRPNFFSGFEDVYYEVNSKEELLASELCKNSVDNGYEICFSKDKEDYGVVMAIREEQNEEGAEWWVLAIIYNTQDVATLSKWLPDWSLKREEYKNKSKKNQRTDMEKLKQVDAGYEFNKEGCGWSETVITEECVLAVLETRYDIQIALAIEYKEGSKTKSIRIVTKDRKHYKLLFV